MKPDSGMYGIKYIKPPHVDYEMFNKVFDQDDGRHALMNFKEDFRRGASRIPVHHQALVYVIKWQKFVWAIEFTGTLEDGDRALSGHGLNPGDLPAGIPKEYSIYRPIRFLARVDPPRDGPHRQEVCDVSGVDFLPKPQRGGHVYKSRDEYQRLFDAIDWTWRADSGGPPPQLESPADRQPVELLRGLIPNPDKLLERVRHVRDGTERDKEDVVKALLVQLGHREEDIRFRRGRVDIQVTAPSGGALAVVEVKRSLPDQRDQARRQAIDYAMMTGAPLVVLTDADEYEVYDRREGLTFESTFRGGFSLTNFRRGDGEVLGLLRVPR